MMKKMFFLSTLQSRFGTLAGLFCALSAVLAAGPARGDSTTTQPAPQTQPSASADSIKHWFDQLSDANPTVREQAADQLMQLTRDDLTTLRRIVQEESPLAPTQIEALPEIVSQVYLSGEPYEPLPESGFLGIAPEVVDIALTDSAPEHRNHWGILVATRLSGFCGARALRSGDVIIGVEDSPGLGFATPKDFTDAVKQHPAGSTVHFQVVRRGQICEIAIKLDSRPAQLDTDNSPLPLSQHREHAFASYWAANFASLVAEEISLSDSGDGPSAQR